MTDEEIKDFMEYFKGEMPNPEHHPLKVMWLMKWYKSIVLRNRERKKTHLHIMSEMMNYITSLRQLLEKISYQY